MSYFADPGSERGWKLEKSLGKMVTEEEFELDPEANREPLGFFSTRRPAHMRHRLGHLTGLLQNPRMSPNLGAKRASDPRR